MENNFKCPECNKEYYIPEYIMKFEQGEMRYYQKTIRIVCSEDREPLLPVNKGGEVGFNFGKFQAMSPLEKQASLRKRAREHGKKMLN